MVRERIAFIVAGLCLLHLIGMALVSSHALAQNDDEIGKTVATVRIDGNHVVNLSKLPRLATRTGEPFDPRLLEEDKRALAATGKFLDVQPKLQEVPGGVAVIFEVVEKPLIRYVKYVGNKKIKENKLKVETQLEVGGSLDPYAIQDGKRKIEDYYRARGYNYVQVTIKEGLNPGDRGVVYYIDEGYSEKVLWTKFVGNTIASDARLRTQIQSKPGLLWIFKGYVEPSKIEEDKIRLTNYYRSLGFFQAKVSADTTFSEEGRWATITFVISEGPRYIVRDIKVVGNEKFSTEELRFDAKLTPGMYFDQTAQARDVAAMKDVYGSQGYVFAEVNPEPRFDLEPGYLDIVYEIVEGQRYRVGKIYVTIAGENPRTKEKVVRDRISLKTGDIVDTRKLRDSERRLRASGLFLNDPTTGKSPKIVFSPPEDEEEVADKPKKGDKFRGQSPDHGEPITDIHLIYDSEEEFHQEHPELELVPADETNSTVQPPMDGSQMRGPHVPDGQEFAARPIDESRVRFQSPGWGASPAARDNSGYGGQMVGAVGPEYRAVHQPTAQELSSQISQAQYNQPIGTSGGPAPSYVQPVQGYAQPAPGFDQPATGFNLPQPVQNYQPGQIYQNGGPAPGAYNNLQQPPVVGADPAYAQPGAVLGGPPMGVPMPPPVDESGNVQYQFQPPAEPYIDLFAEASEAPTGRFMFGVGVNSDAGVVGNLTIDEQNFDLLRFPSSWEDVRSGKAWRGAGQRFRIEAAPGTRVQRYSVSFAEPYFWIPGFNQAFGYSVSASYYERVFTDWDEERISLRNALSYQLRPDLTLTGAIRLEQVGISRPTEPTPPELAEVIGDNELYGFKIQLTHDTRDSPYMPTEGHLIEVGFEQVVGTFDYPRETIEARKYFTMHQRPDGSGRHVLAVGGQVGFTGSDTPIYDHFYAGGFSTLRGFRFRGASPRNMGVIVGGEFELLGTTEYMFPITADDMLRGVAFVDFGTVEEKVRIDAGDFRVAPGVGLRISVPALGPAPIALDLAFPIAEEAGDEKQVFSFFVGAMR